MTCTIATQNKPLEVYRISELAHILDKYHEEEDDLSQEIRGWVFSSLEEAQREGKGENLQAFLNLCLQDLVRNILFHPAKNPGSHAFREAMIRWVEPLNVPTFTTQEVISLFHTHNQYLIQRNQQLALSIRGTTKRLSDFKQELVADLAKHKEDVEQGRIALENRHQQDILGLREQHEEISKQHARVAQQLHQEITASDRRTEAVSRMLQQQQKSLEYEKKRISVLERDNAELNEQLQRALAECDDDGWLCSIM